MGNKRNLMKKNFNKHIFSLSLIGVISSIYLIILDNLIINYCPKLFFISACYIVFATFLLILIAELFDFLINRFLFIIGCIIGIILAIWFSINEIINSNICPRVFEIPMCYLSLCIFLMIFLLKIKDTYHLKIKNNRNF
jgi:hypothetical protein